jgi:uncharacterized damage-inducible protein DinB
MKVADALLPEFDHEMATTRKLLERVPDDKLDWTPHPKSWNLARLATHVANIPTWAVYTINHDSLDVGGMTGPTPIASREELLNVFDKAVAEARTAIAGAENDKLFQTWSLTAGEKTFFSMPRVAVLRSFVMNHHIHHRGQLSLYLRLNDVPLPSIYGPTADEPGM